MQPSVLYLASPSSYIMKSARRKRCTLRLPIGTNAMMKWNERKCVPTGKCFKRIEGRGGGELWVFPFVPPKSPSSGRVNMLVRQCLSMVTLYDDAFLLTLIARTSFAKIKQNKFSIKNWYFLTQPAFLSRRYTNKIYQINHLPKQALEGWTRVWDKRTRSSSSSIPVMQFQF